MEEELIQYLLAIGALEQVGEDEEKNPLYILTENSKELVPELYKEHMKDFNMAVFSLWSKNLIDVVFDDKGEALIQLNENSKNVEKNNNLSESESSALKEIVFFWEKETEE